MDNLELRFYVWLLLRRSPIIIVFTAIGAAIGVFMALSMPSTYEAVAKILVEQPRVSADLARSSVPVSSLEQLQIIQQQLTTRANLIDMAQQYDVYANGPRPSDADIVQDMRERTRLQPLHFDTPSGYGGALAFAVSFEAQDPVLAADIANAFASTILETNARVRRERAGEALTFARAEVDRLSQALAKIGEDIARFKAEHEDALPDSLETRREQESNLDNRLSELRREEDQLAAKRLALSQIYAKTSGTGLVGEATPEEELLNDLRRTLAEHRAIFTETSSIVVALRQRIEALESAAKERRSQSVAEGEPSEMPAELQLQFADIDSRIVLLREERESSQARLAELRQSIAATARNTNELERLQRDYDNTQTQYNAAAARLADASTGARIEQEAIGEKLSLIESAVPPEKPSNSKRKLVAAGGAAGGFALAIALLLGFELWRAAIYRPAEVARVFEGEPISVIPFIPRKPTTGRPRLQMPRAAAAVLLMLGFAGQFRSTTPPWPEPVSPAGVEDEQRTANSAD